MTAGDDFAAIETEGRVRVFGALSAYAETWRERAANPDLSPETRAHAAGEAAACEALAKRVRAALVPARERTAESSPSKACARCLAPVADADPERCWRCAEPLCAACWEAHGACSGGQPPTSPPADPG